MSEFVKQENATKATNLTMSDLIVPRSQSLGYTELETKFVMELLRTGEMDIAQQNCAMTDDHIKNLLYSTNYDSLMRSCIQDVFSKRLVPRALARLSEYGEKNADPNRGQLDAMKTILDRAGMVAPKASEPEKHNLEMQHWSEAKLNEFIAIAQGEIATKRAPNAPPLKPQVIDVLE